MMKRATLENHRLEALQVSMRALHRVARMIDSNAKDPLVNAQLSLQRVFEARLDFMPTATRQMVNPRQSV